MAEATLYFRKTCRRCRLLARLSVIASFRALRAVPLDSPAAQRLYERYPATRGKLALVDGDRCYCAWKVVPAGLAVAGRGAARRLRMLLSGLSPG